MRVMDCGLVYWLNPGITKHSYSCALAIIFYCLFLLSLICQHSNVNDRKSQRQTLINIIIKLYSWLCVFICIPVSSLVH